MVKKVTRNSSAVTTREDQSIVRLLCYKHVAAAQKFRGNAVMTKLEFNLIFHFQQLVRNRTSSPVDMRRNSTYCNNPSTAREEVAHPASHRPAIAGSRHDDVGVARQNRSWQQKALFPSWQLPLAPHKVRWAVWATNLIWLEWVGCSKDSPLLVLVHAQCLFFLGIRGRASHLFILFQSTYIKRVLHVVWECYGRVLQKEQIFYFCIESIASLPLFKKNKCVAWWNDMVWEVETLPNVLELLYHRSCI